MVVPEGKGEPGDTSYVFITHILQMMADLLFRKGEYHQASQHFQELLGKKPGTWRSVVGVFVQSLI